MPWTVTSGTADHGVLMDRRAVEADRLLRVVAVGKVGDGKGIGASQRDVTGRVLVEQDVPEDTAAAADGRRAVDQRDLAQPGRARIRGEAGAKQVGPGVGVDLDGAAGGEPKSQSFHHAAAEQLHRTGRANGALGAARIRRGEDLLGGHVRHRRSSPAGGDAARHPARPRHQADRQVGLRAGEVQRVEPPLRELFGTQRELLQVIPPGLDGVVLVEPDDGSDQAPQLIEIGRAQEALGDPLTRAGHERPVHLAAAHRGEQRRRQRHVVCSRPGRVDVCEQRRIGVAPDHDHGAAPLDAVGDQPLIPGGDEIKRVSGRVPQPCPLCVLIPVQHGHVAGARLVGGFRDRHARSAPAAHPSPGRARPARRRRSRRPPRPACPVVARSGRAATRPRSPRSQGAWLTMRLTVQDRRRRRGPRHG